MLCDEELKDCMTDIIKKTNTMPIFTTTNTGVLSAFQHPDTEQIYIQRSDVEERLDVCSKLLKVFPNESFVFRNHNYGSIGFYLI